MKIATYISQVVKDSFRDVKVSIFGRNDTRTTFLGTSFGEDYIPVKGTKMVQISSTNSSESVIVCIVNKADDSLSVGEKVIYSTDENGVIQAQIYLRNDGKIEVKGTSVEFLEGGDNAVRYSELERAFNDLLNKYNDLASNWNAFASAYIAGGPSTQGFPTTVQSGSTSSADITKSRIDEIKVP